MRKKSLNNAVKQQIVHQAQLAQDAEFIKAAMQQSFAAQVKQMFAPEQTIKTTDKLTKPCILIT